MPDHSRHNGSNKRSFWSLLLIVLIGIFFLASCGGDGEKLTENGLRPKLAEAIKFTEDSKFDDAKAAFVALLADNPNDLEIMGYFALMSVKSGRTKDAIMYAEAVLEKDPKQALPYVVLGKIQYMASHFKKATELSRKALQIDPNLGDAYLVIGEIYLRQGMVEKSLPVLKKGLALLPADVDAYKKYSSALIKGGKPKEALEVLHTAMKMNPNVAGIHFNLALAYYKLKDGDKAMYHIDTAEKLYMEADEKNWANKSRQTKRAMAKSFNMSPESLGP